MMWTIFIILSIACVVEPKSYAPPKFGKKCIKKLGCFTNGPPFYDPKYRPNSRLPDELTKGTYHVFSYKDPDKGYTLKKPLASKDVSNSPLTKHTKTIILVHGYYFNMIHPKQFLKYQYRIKDELLERGPFNVIVVDWHLYSHFNLDVAYANGRVLGAEIALLTKMLNEHKDIANADIHIIGHSLGAHVAGWAGERMEGLGRISAIDPLKKMFESGPKMVKLDKTDAVFVDVIHTNGGEITKLDKDPGYGIREPIGHADFYPNGGHRQDACHLEDVLSKRSASRYGVMEKESKDRKEREKKMCDHIMGMEYYISSINKCYFVSETCDDYLAYRIAQCKQTKEIKQNRLGFAATKPPGSDRTFTRFYVIPTRYSPYCQS